MPSTTAQFPVSLAPLTFGVELEFVLYPDRGTPDPLRRIARPAPLITVSRFNTIDAETVFQLSAELRKQGITVRKDPAGWDARMVQIPVEDQVGGEWADTEMLVWDHDEAAAQTSDVDIEDDWGCPRPKHYENGWLVDFDSTVVSRILYGRAMEAECDHLEGIKWKGVEVISKIFTAGEEAFQEVGKVANILSKTFRTEVNRSCGLHIHVGNGDAGFDLEALKNLAGALWVFDREIIRLHPRYRTSLRRPNTAASSFCGSILGRFPPKGQLKRILHKFYAAKNFSELIFWLRGSKYQAYNFNNLSAGAPANERDTKKKETIEFRQHEATLYSGRVQRWARFCVGIVQWAKDSSPETMKQFLLRDLERQKAGNGLELWDLIGVTLGMPDDAKAWKTFILEKEKSRAFRRAAKQKEKRLSIPPNSESKADETSNGLGEPSPPPSEVADPWGRFDSDDDSEYGEEIAYYGTKSCKVDSKNATKSGPGSWLGHHREYDSEW